MTACRGGATTIAALTGAIRDRALRYDGVPTRGLPDGACPLQRDLVISQIAWYPRLESDMTVDRSRNSQSLENLIEHLFLAELLRHMWCSREQAVEVAKAEVDSWGYDVVLTAGKKTRYVQLKTSVPTNVNELLAQREGGCVVAALFDDDFRIARYRIWEAKSGISQLPIAKSTRYSRASQVRKSRVGHRLVRASLFSRQMDMASLCDILFPLEKV